MDALSLNKPLADATKTSAAAMSPPEPKVDLGRFHAGDPDLFQELFARVEPRLVQVIARWSQDSAHADDLLQETRVRIYKKRTAYSGSGSFTGWAAKLCLNVCRADRRMAGRDPTVPIDEHEEIAATAPSPEAELRRKRRTTVVRQALQRLDEREREAVVARYFERRSTAEIARRMQVTETVVAALLAKALRKFRCMEDVMELLLDTE